MALISLFLLGIYCFLCVYPLGWRTVGAFQNCPLLFPSQWLLSHISRFWYECFFSLIGYAHSVVYLGVENEHWTGLWTPWAHCESDLCHDWTSHSLIIMEGTMVLRHWESKSTQVRQSLQVPISHWMLTWVNGAVHFGGRTGRTTTESTCCGMARSLFMGPDFSFSHSGNENWLMSRSLASDHDFSFGQLPADSSSAILDFFCWRMCVIPLLAVYQSCQPRKPCSVYHLHSSLRVPAATLTLISLWELCSPCFRWWHTTTRPLLF